jgi:large subunit ribosomal protein L13
MMLMVIDAEDAILGRISSHIARALLEGSDVVVVNAEKAVVTGDKEMVFAEYKEKADMGHRYAGPFYPKPPHMIFKRTVRGMLPWKTARGKNALKKLIVHIGVPDDFAGKQRKIPEASLGSGTALKFVRLGKIAEYLGWTPKM